MGSHWRVVGYRVTLPNLYFGKFSQTTLGGKAPYGDRWWQGDKLGRSVGKHELNLGQ